MPVEDWDQVYLLSFQSMIKLEIRVKVNFWCLEPIGQRKNNKLGSAYVSYLPVIIFTLFQRPYDVLLSVNSFNSGPVDLCNSCF